MKKTWTAFLVIMLIFVLTGCKEIEKPLFHSIEVVESVEQSNLQSSSIIQLQDGTYQVKQRTKLYLVVHISQPTKAPYELISVKINGVMFEVGEHEYANRSDSRIIFANDDQTKMFIPITSSHLPLDEITYELNQIMYKDHEVIQTIFVPSSKTSRVEIITQDYPESNLTTLKVSISSLPKHLIPHDGQSVSQLLFDYDTVVLTKDGKYIVNPMVVKNNATILQTVEIHNPREVIKENQSTLVRDKTYTFEIYDDLTYSDGSPIKAKDYVFALLFRASLDWKKQGLGNVVGETLFGFENYHPTASQDLTSSADRYFTGIRLINEYTFSVTINGEYLPSFHELSHLIFTPLPYHLLAAHDFNPDIDMVSNNQGTKLSNKAFEQIFMLKQDSGYFTYPTIVSGPFVLESFIDQTMTFKRNEFYRGNFEDKFPKIRTIVITKQSYPLNLENEILENKISLFTDINEAATINGIISHDSIQHQYRDRNGFGTFAFNCDFGPTSDYKVRQAIGFLFDRNEFIAYILGGYGSKDNSFYVKSQWMYQEKQTELSQTLINYEQNIDYANELLSTTQWKYEVDGITLFDAQKARISNDGTIEGNTYFRHNAAGEVLEIRHLSDSSAFFDNLYGTVLQRSFAPAGIKVTIDYAEFNTILDHYYYSYKNKPSPSNATDRRVYHTFFLFKNIIPNEDPYYSFHSDWYETRYNPSQLIDSIDQPAIPLEVGEKTLDELMILMKETSLNDETQYLEYWYQFVLRWNKLLPMIPLYNNHYYYVYHPKLKGLTITAYWDWTHSICDIYIEE